MRLLYSSFLLLTFLTACGPKIVSSSSGASSAIDYNPDLSAYRPRYTGREAAGKPGFLDDPAAGKVPVIAPLPPARKTDKVLTVNQRIDPLLDTLASRNNTITYISGYRIQLYSGTRRNEMDAAKVYLYQHYSELSPYVAYNHPTYRLRVGDFATRMDAERYLSLLRSSYPYASIVADRILLKDALKIMSIRSGG